MKRILFLIVCLMSFSAKADDYDDEVLCFVTGDNPYDASVDIQEFCERNDILVVLDVDELTQIVMIAEYCRYDRNISMQKDALTCILHSNKARLYKPMADI